MAKIQKYNSPIDEFGNKYWIPIVCKDKEYLISYMMGVYSVLDVLDIDDNISTAGLLDSSRFNDIIDRDGTRAGQLSTEEIKNLVLKKQLERKKSQSHPDNKDVEMPLAFIHLFCDCGNYYGFKTPENLPNERFYCELCDKVLIDYTHKYDNEFVYDG